ncbi:MAG: hypothetical protein AAF921_25180 [Cyanobacteria bacterium P01_D01_bin.44]
MQLNQTVTLGYNKAVGLMLLLAGGINLFLSVWILLLGELSITIVTGIIVTTIGLLYLTKPYFAVEPDRVVMYNLLGMPVKTYTLEPSSTVSIEGNQLYINTSGTQTKVSVTKWLTSPNDWQRLSKIAKTA